MTLKMLCNSMPSPGRDPRIGSRTNLQVGVERCTVKTAEVADEMVTMWKQCGMLVLEVEGLTEKQGPLDQSRHLCLRCHIRGWRLAVSALLRSVNLGQCFSRQTGNALHWNV